ncbi:hypothetical protein CQA66_05800 [Helicobacter aurati]|uniref:Uncharacterized protein n=1 Tax=Helicobacter aurati TaxID=137778 RepID=A0A3D8J502_9HELI|nr:hypothetical protein [Helicobacter aurati]RDU71974.1 hypothetical protein CQA66_05800 [Helicobacter aurati]
MRYVLVMVVCVLQFIFAEEKSLKQAEESIQLREKFFKESFAQQYDALKIQRNSTAMLEFIDFCMYPPDRSLPFGALENGRFKGEKVTDLPFTCNQNSGAKKFFLQDSTLESAYSIFRLSVPFASFLQEYMPQKNTAITLHDSSIFYIWQRNQQNQILRLWVIYHDVTQSRTLIFTQRGKNTEVILQYLTR